MAVIFVLDILRNLLNSFRYCAGMDIRFYRPFWSGLNYMIQFFTTG